MQEAGWGGGSGGVPRGPTVDLPRDQTGRVGRGDNAIEEAMFLAVFPPPLPRQYTGQSLSQPIVTERERANKGRKKESQSQVLGSEQTGFFSFSALSEGDLWWLIIETANPHVEGPKEREQKIPSWIKSETTFHPLTT